MKLALFVIGFIAGGAISCVLTMWFDDCRNS